ncbi:MAG: ABC transporter ATP-binding protein [Eubacteriales bacterium]|nr:ABC transporter ATP-binding protein [Eubacteriales bacterium]
MEKALIVKELVKSYGSLTAVNHLSFEVDNGEIFGLLGHNGAGKTTSIECILGVKRADSGSALIFGKDPKKDRRRVFEKVGVQFQQTNYQDKIRVDEICQVTASLYREPADWEILLDTFGLTEMKRKMVAELSGGERQRLSVLLALIPKPELVFLDELTTGLDAKAHRDVWRYLEGLKKQGLTIILTSHYMDEVNILCDRICILKKGETIFQGTVAEAVEGSPFDHLEEAYLWYSGEEAYADENL